MVNKYIIRKIRLKQVKDVSKYDYLDVNIRFVFLFLTCNKGEFNF